MNLPITLDTYNNYFKNNNIITEDFKNLINNFKLTKNNLYYYNQIDEDITFYFANYSILEIYKESKIINYLNLLNEKYDIDHVY